MFFFHKRYTLVTMLTFWRKDKPKRYVHRNGVGVWIEPGKTARRPACSAICPPVKRG